MVLLNSEIKELAKEIAKELKKISKTTPAKAKKKSK